MNLFQENDYRKIIKTLFREKPNSGHGQTSRLARYLGVNTTLVSQVLGGRRDFTEEQALATAEFLEFNSRESFYFLVLVQFSRAGSEPLKAIYSQQIKKLQGEAKNLNGRVSAHKELSFEQQAVYYSIWLYAAIHSLVSIDGYQTAAAVARKLGIDEGFARALIDRLVADDLLNEKGGRLLIGATSTYIAPDSPLVVRHHQSWRQVASQKMTTSLPKDLFFTAPMSISAADLTEFRQDIVELLSRLYKRVEATKPEKLACLNIDLFEV